ncbi:MAG: hypothetical protein NTX03_02355 [Bacteroidetes bacterium]|nr:hypothetical protein [Bacteroidota bacterium]
MKKGTAQTISNTSSIGFIQEEENKNRMAEDIAKELNGAAYETFFSKYHPLSKAEFIKAYAQKKANYLCYSTNVRQKEESKNSKQLTNAYEALWEIQQKKLFDLQCLWRAEEVTIPSIESTLDFIYWEKNIAECNVITCITIEDINLYVDYVNSDFYTEALATDTWQDYDAYKEALNAGIYNLPAWYEFNDSQTQNRFFEDLPDIRGHKEKAYTNMFGTIEEHHNSNKNELPWLDIYSRGVMENFIKQNENKNLLQAFKAYERDLKKRNQYITVEAALEVLKDAEEPVSIPAGGDWQQQIIQAAIEYKKSVLINNIYFIFDEYTMRLEAGISQQPPTHAFQSEMVAEVISRKKSEILFGRKMNDEPEDFNF